MNELDISAESFQIKFEKFLIGCEAVANATLWDVDTYGEMQDYYAALLVSIILRSVTADGWVSDREANYLNKLFGFTYESGELEQVYENCAEMIQSEGFEEELTADIDRLRSCNARLADSFADLVALVCDIITKSDGFVTDEEKAEIDKIRGLIA